MSKMVKVDFSEAVYSEICLNAVPPTVPEDRFLLNVVIVGAGIRSKD